MQVLHYSLLGLIVVSQALPAFAQNSKTKFYRWVDEQGKVQYSSIPPKQNQSAGISEISKHGVVIKKAETVEERTAKQALQTLKAKNEQLTREAKRKDRALLDSYTSVQQIGEARDKKIETIQNAINAYMPRKKNTQNQLATLEQNRQGFISRQQPVPEPLEKNIATVKKEIEQLDELLDSRKKEIQSIRKQADKDIKRYNELTSGS